MHPVRSKPSSASRPPDGRHDRWVSAHEIAIGPAPAQMTICGPPRFANVGTADAGTSSTMAPDPKDRMETVIRLQIAERVSRSLGGRVSRIESCDACGSRIGPCQSSCPDAGTHQRWGSRSIAPHARAVGSGLGPVRSHRAAPLLEPTANAEAGAARACEGGEPRILFPTPIPIQIPYSEVLSSEPQ